MKTKIVEATNPGGINWGKFMIAVYDNHDWSRASAVDTGRPLLRSIGTNPQQIWVLDLQTGEGAMFRAHSTGYPKADLDRHRVWVCPLFEPFLQWLYQQDLSGGPEALPDLVELPEARSAVWGYRRDPGSQT